MPYETTTRDCHDEAIAVGLLYRDACKARCTALERLLLAGQTLDKIKDQTPHGEWLLWLKEHQEQLGFSERTAQRLLYLARNASSTTDLTDEQQAAALRLVWGNEPAEVTGRQSPDRFTLFARWITEHRAAEFPVSDPVVLAEQIRVARTWLDELESQLTVSRAA